MCVLVPERVCECENVRLDGAAYFIAIHNQYFYFVSKVEEGGERGVVGVKVLTLSRREGEKSKQIKRRMTATLHHLLAVHFFCRILVQ